MRNYSELSDYRAFVWRAIIVTLEYVYTNKNGADGEVCRHSSALVLKRNTGSDDTYQRIGFQLWVERMVFQDALETEVTIIDLSHPPSHCTDTSEVISSSPEKWG